jgi:indole-3-glycerol phosphate synthase
VTATLEHIVASTRRRVGKSRERADFRELEQMAAKHTPRGFCAALVAAAQSGPAIIAELKKASPSRGLIRAEFYPHSLAVALVEAGAAALSVLTDEEFFQGSLENLQIASSATTVPCLRKDFIIDEFQLLESRAHCADAILLIVAALSQSELTTLARKSAESGLDVLCEVHDEDELCRALDAGCGLIGVNSRDLKTFRVDLNTAIMLGKLIPKSVVSVAESGIHSGQDLARLRGEGYSAFLIGESLMKEPLPGAALRRLLNEAKVTVSSA